jgi:hypothetical protein
MKRVITATFLATAFAVGLSAQAPAPAQPSPQAQPPISKDAAKSVTVTGCLKAGDSADTFILSNLKWSDKDKATGVVGTAGSATVPAAVASATTLKIIPSASTKLTGHIGHTIEVTGTVSDKDKIDRGAATAPSTDPASPRPSASSSPSMEVRTLKMVSETCTPQ